MMQAVVQCERVSAAYRRHRVLSDLDLTLGPGTTVLLGPNGAGKSTLLQILATQRKADSGTVRVLGQDIGVAREREIARHALGFLPQSYPLVGTMRARDLIAYAAWSHGLAPTAAYRAADRVIGEFELGHLRDRRVGRVSGGERQRIGIAATVAHEPRLVILDEPTAGLDPEATMLVRAIIKAMSARTAVLLATHLADDATHLADVIVLIDRGQPLFIGAPAQLEQYSGPAGPGPLGSALERAYRSILAASRQTAHRGQA